MEKLLNNNNNSEIYNKKKVEQRESNIEVNIDDPYENKNEEKQNILKNMSRKKNFAQINYYNNLLYPNEDINTNPEKIICVNSANMPKSNNTKRIMLFNVHNFVSHCLSTKDNINMNIFIPPKSYIPFFEFINDKQLDYLMLTELTPMVDNPNENKHKLFEITTEGTFTGITKNMENIQLNNNFIALTHTNDLPTDFYFLANGIFGNTNLLNKKTYNIGPNRIIMECIIDLFETNFLLFITHVEDKYADSYIINIDNIINVVNNAMIDNKINNIILGGDFNFPIGEVDINEGNRNMTIQKYKITPEQAFVIIPIEPANPLIKLTNLLKIIEPENKNEINFTGFFKRKIIDHFFVSENVLQNFDVTTNILRSSVSDHYPVILDIMPKKNNMYGGNNYYQKYIKYKNKYLNLKKYM
jgi:endonuclease/exonuclease/phosphatase family metal-dependent hydrolase